MRRYLAGAASGLLAVLVCCGTGCMFFPAPTADGNTSKPVGEPNDTFDSAIPTEFDEEGVAHLQGTIEVSHDVDVFDLGPLEPGDRVTVDVTAHLSGLDAAVALFDRNGRLFVENDDRDLGAELLDPLIDQPIRLGSDHYFLGISDSAFGPGTGSYTITVTVTRGGPVPPPELQVFFLDFDGGSVTIPGEDLGPMEPFDTGTISPAYAGMTEEVKTAIVNRFVESYDGLDVLTVSSDQGEAAAGEAFSRILFGGMDPSKFGISQNVDPLNAVHTDVAVIFTETFRPGLFGRTLSAEELGTAIGNVAAHEAGHLLGLNHVADISALMDTSGGPETLLLQQIFKEAPLDGTIFPIGTQDAWLLLQVILGLT